MRGDRRRQRILEFFFGDYIDARGAVLEVGRGESWLRDYLIGAGFRDYQRLDSRPPADLVGDPERWRDLGVEPASVDLLIAFDPELTAVTVASLRDLVRPGGLMFLLRRVPPARWTERLRGWIGGEPPASAAKAGVVAGFRTLAERRTIDGERLLRLQRLVESRD